MHIDVFTAVLIAGISSFIMSFAMLGASRSYPVQVPGTNKWVWACAAQSVGWVLIGLRGRIPDWISIYVGNAVLMAAYLTYYFALKEFRNQSYRRWLMYLLIPGV